MPAPVGEASGATWASKDLGPHRPHFPKDSVCHQAGKAPAAQKREPRGALHTCWASVSQPVLAEGRTRVPETGGTLEPVGRRGPGLQQWQGHARSSRARTSITARRCANVSSASCALGRGVWAWSGGGPGLAWNKALTTPIIAGCHAVTLDRLSPPVQVTRSPQPPHIPSPWGPHCSGRMSGGSWATADSPFSWGGGRVGAPL